MDTHYDQKSDTLYITLSQQREDAYDFSTGDFTVTTDEWDNLTHLTIRHASKFVKEVLGTGIVVPTTTAMSPANDKPTWEDVDSSMISAFKYDEKNGTLDVIFHRTGTYRYFDVPLKVVEGLRKASSKGSYMRDMIIDMYYYEKGKR